MDYLNNIFIYYSVNFVVVIIIIQLIFLWKNRKIYKNLRNIKTYHYPVLPIFGHTYLLINKTNMEVFDFLVDVGSQMTSPIKFHMGPYIGVMISKPEDMQSVLTAPNGLQKHYLYKFFKNKTGLVTAHPDFWRPVRKQMNPFFGRKFYSQNVETINKCAISLADCFERKVGLEEFDCLHSIMYDYLNMMSSTFMDFEYNTKKYPDMKNLPHAIIRASELIMNRSRHVWEYPDFLYDLTKDGKDFNKRVNTVYSVTNKIISKKKAEFESLGDGEKPNILINRLFELQGEGKLNALEVREQLDTIFVAGFETTSIAQAFTLLQLAIHPEIQEQVYQEICDVIVDDVINYDVIMKLVYMDMMIKEVLRLHPTVPFVYRTSGDIKLNSCTLPAGILLAVSIFNLHRDPIIWGPKADRFDPDNFLPDRVASRHLFSYLPFSGGPRNCIGARHAILSLKISLCHLLKRFKFRTTLKEEDLKYEIAITLKLQNGHMISVERR